MGIALKVAQVCFGCFLVFADEILAGTAGDDLSDRGNVFYEIVSLADHVGDQIDRRGQ